LPRPPHIDRILKLLLLGGRNNPSEHERAAAMAKAEALMARHGVTLQEMRELYRREQGLPPRPGPGRPAPAPARPGRRGPGRIPEPDAWDRFERDAMERARNQPEGGGEARRRETERERLRERLRPAILEAIASHRDFAGFFGDLASRGIQASMASEEAMERITYRWPPDFTVSVESTTLGPGCDWPSLLEAGLRFDPLDPGHREAWTAMLMK
jgi:hypothetical protein